MQTQQSIEEIKVNSNLDRKKTLELYKVYRFLATEVLVSTIAILVSKKLLTTVPSNITNAILQIYFLAIFVITSHFVFNDWMIIRDMEREKISNLSLFLKWDLPIAASMMYMVALPFIVK